MFKKIFSLVTITLTLSACSVDTIKPTITNSLKTLISTKATIETSIIPNGDQKITIDGKEHTIPAQTFDNVKTYINANKDAQNAIIDLIGSQITDENIALIAYYVDKYSIPIKDLIQSISQTNP